MYLPRFAFHLVLSSFISAHEETKEDKEQKENKKPEIPEHLRVPQPSELELIKAAQVRMAQEFSELKQLLMSQTIKDTKEDKKVSKKKEEDTETPNTAMVREFREELAAHRENMKKVQEEHRKELERIQIETAVKELETTLEGKYDPKMLDKTSFESFKKSIPAAVQAYEETRNYFFNQFQAQMKATGQQIISATTQQRMVEQQALLGNVASSKSGSNIAQSDNQKNNNVQFVHPQIDGGRSFAAVRQSLLGNMLGETSSGDAMQRRFITQNVENPTQLQYQQQQQQILAQRQQSNVVQQSTQGNVLVIPLPDNVVGGASVRAMNPAESNAAMQAATQAILSKRANPRRLQAMGAGANLYAAMYTSADGATEGAGPNMRDAMNRAAADDRTPGALVR